MRKHWTIPYLQIIVCFLIPSISMWCAPTEEIALQEMRIARQALERETASLKQELVRVNAELDRVRTLYAETIIRQRAEAEQLRKLELQAASLVQVGSGDSVAGTMTEAMQVLVLLRTRLLKVESELTCFEKSMAAAMDVMQPSDAMRHDVEDRVVSLRRVVESSLKPLSLVAGRGSGDAILTGCTVLSADLQTQTVILDKGFLDGCRSGMVFIHRREGTVTARLKVVEVRPDISAAVVVVGRFVAVTPGTLFAPELSMR